MKQFLLLSIILSLFNVAVSAQKTTILKGKITDQETSEGIAFVSVGIEGTYIGVASNPDGIFELKVPDEKLSGNIYLSAIGYKNAIYPISDFPQKENISILLVPQSYSIQEIDVAAESKVLQRILRTASERIPENYLKGPLNMKFFTEKRSSSDQNNSKSEKYMLDLYDAKGYSNPSWTEAFKSRSYQIRETETDFSTKSFREASLEFDELLEMDLARMSNTILNPDLLNDYSLHLDSKTRFNGDSVWIISYDARKHDLAHTGSFYPSGFAGKIYVACADYAVLRNEIHLTETKSNPQGRSLAVKSNARTQTQMNITVGYKKLQGKYVLAFIDSEKQFRSAEKKAVYESWKATVLEVDTKGSVVIPGRDYFAEIKPNSEFWKTFSLPLR